MAEIESKSDGQKRHRSSTKIDMTPMVDLAFLLITFFMLTTTFITPQTMEVNMPDKGENTMPVSHKRTLTVILGKENRLICYTGIAGDSELPAVVQSTDFSEKGIRQILLKQRETIGEQMLVVIKASDAAKYQNMVDILDEMQICRIGTYAITDITPADLALIEAN